MIGKIIIHHMRNNICLTGAIYDEEKLLELFKKAIICISPNQAGLSVQKSMGYGVPFVTSREAFTGGEIFDITDEDSDLINFRHYIVERIMTQPDVKMHMVATSFNKNFFHFS